MTYPLEGDDKSKHNGLDDQHDWFHQFTPRSGYIDGVFTITGESEKTLVDTLKMVENTFGIGLQVDKPSIQLVFQQQGHVLSDDREQYDISGSSYKSCKANIHGLALGGLMVSPSLLSLVWTPMQRSKKPRVA